jgi:hypothetical protein
MLFSGLFINDVKVSAKMYDMISLISLIVFFAAIYVDKMLGLLVISICYVMFTKVKMSERFSDVPSKTVTEVKNPNKIKDNQIKIDTKIPSQMPTVERNEPCKNQIASDELFLNQFSTSKKQLENVQTNVFDKYNNGVFYNEMGTNSLDIQGVFNHDVIGYEKL